MMETFQRLQREAVRLLQAGSPPTGEEGQVLAKAYWDMVLEFTGGDMSMLPQLMEVERVDSPDPTWKDQQQALHAFLEPALEAYFDRMGFDPFKGETE